VQPAHGKNVVPIERGRRRKHTGRHPEHRTSGFRSWVGKKRADRRHSERREESGIDGEILRFAQDDGGVLGMAMRCSEW